MFREDSRNLTMFTHVCRFRVSDLLQTSGARLDQLYAQQVGKFEASVALTIANSAARI